VLDVLWCYLIRGHHEPIKHPFLSGFRCERCGMALADLDEAGFIGEGYVRPLRTTFRRAGEQAGKKHGDEITRGAW